MLINGIDMPNLCFGTDITYLHNSGLKRKISEVKCIAKMKLNKDKYYAAKTYYLPRMIDYAMRNGCTMFDTSRAYGCSEYVLGMVLAKYPRESYFIATKLCNGAQYSGKVRESFEESLKELKMDYVDLYLMHWPVEGHYIESWKILEELYESGKCRAIGVCNCNIHHLETLRENAKIMPMVNEIECHPLFTQDELRKYCNMHDIRMMAYTSTARMDERLRKTCLVPISMKYGKSIAQVILRWHQQIGNIPIVNSTRIEHMAQNIDISDFKLTDEEIGKITAININSRLRYDPDNCDFRQL